MARFEHFEWVNREAVDNADEHPEVLAMWGRYGECRDFVTLADLSRVALDDLGLNRGADLVGDLTKGGVGTDRIAVGTVCGVDHERCLRCCEMRVERLLRL